MVRLAVVRLLVVRLLGGGRLPGLLELIGVLCLAGVRALV